MKPWVIHRADEIRDTALCGIVGSTTYVPAKVTCKRCIARMASQNCDASLDTAVSFGRY